MKYILSAYHKKVYHIAQYDDFHNWWRSKCNGLFRQSENRVVEKVPKGYRPCKKCYKETKQEEE